MRDAWAGRIDLQAVSIATLERFAGDDGVALANEVANSGGILGMTTTGEGGQAASPEFQALLDRFFRLAEERGLAMDLHLDENGDAQSRTLDAVARTALRRGFRAPIQVGHVCSLSVQEEDAALATIARCAEAGISVINLPMCNMYLQGRASRPDAALARHHHGARIPRRRRAGVVRLRQLRAIRSMPMATTT